MKLHELKPVEGSKKRRKRVGRGLGSGSGTYAGRGRKGQHARQGGVKGPYFEGGNLPLVRKLPFARGVGFTSRGKIHYVPINLSDLAALASRSPEWSEGEPVTPEVLHRHGLLKSADDPVVILAYGEIERAVTVRAHRFSASARRKIEAAGGTVEML
ncbi:MAG TPA: 50S ribosomal protein L15 [Anaerolineae bacterium]|jgi:large subunit ribosomal protein L15|nr:50S ribosomal protein L15 [Anaerolineae bacterium]